MQSKVIRILPRRRNYIAPNTKKLNSRQDNRAYIESVYCYVVLVYRTRHVQCYTG